MSDKISIIVPVYKVELYLARCVDSILAQTYENLEIILIDDGSPDNCPALCDAYADRDARIKVIHQENLGLSGARNTGLDAATGDYIGFVDSDDAVHPSMYEVLHRICTQEKAAIALCSYVEFSSEDIPREVPAGSGACHTMTPREAMLKLYGPYPGQYVVSWNKLYGRDIFQGIRFPTGKINEDLHVVCQLYDSANRVAYTDSVLYYYFRGNAGSITQQPHYLTNADIFEGMEACGRYCQERGYKELVESFHSMYLMEVLNRCRATRKGGGRNRELFQVFVRRFRERYRSYPDIPRERRFRIFNRFPRTFFVMEHFRNQWAALRGRN